LKRVVIIGSGGHGRVVYDAIKKRGNLIIVGFVDEKLPVGSLVIDNCNVILGQKDLNKLSEITDYFIIAIGDNKIRHTIFLEASKYSNPISVIHPSAYVADDAEINEGTIVLSNSTISTGVIIGKNSIINSNVVVDHDSTIGMNVHLKIGTLIGSNSRVSDFETTNIGESIPEFSDK
jgi:sugar O-acyltransferase (sialic acid O-acetyltransferase NeuD family)